MSRTAEELALDLKLLALEYIEMSADKRCVLWESAFTLESQQKLWESLTSRKN